MPVRLLCAHHICTPVPLRSTGETYVFGLQNVGTPLSLFVRFFVFFFLHGLGGNLVNFLRLGGCGSPGYRGSAAKRSFTRKTISTRRSAAAVSGIGPWLGPGRPWVTAEPFVHEQRSGEGRGACRAVVVAEDQRGQALSGAVKGGFEGEGSALPCIMDRAYRLALHLIALTGIDGARLRRGGPKAPVGTRNTERNPEQSPACPTRGAHLCHLLLALCCNLRVRQGLVHLGWRFGSWALRSVGVERWARSRGLALYPLRASGNER